jgi:hypothetical protein
VEAEMNEFRTSKHLVAAVAVAASVMTMIPGGAFAQNAPPAPPAVGDAARDFTLHRLDGQAVTLSALEKSGPVVVLMLRGWVGYQ